MGRPQESAELLLKGFSPSKIASKFGISTKSVKQYLFVAIGMGLIRRSDILFSIDRSLRIKLNQ
jgi:predicted transcriptional regulator